MLYRSLLRPLLFRLPPEAAHNVALHSLAFALATSTTRNLIAHSFKCTPFGELRRFGLSFANPVGLAAGFDKDGVALEALSALGFGFIEAGTVTYAAQPGNERPRVFRLPKDRALINRLGFNNEGAAAFARRATKNRPDCVLGVSIGKSKLTRIDEAVDDYLQCFEIVHPVADYIAVNVSSPNTPRLRELQQADQLASLLGALQKRNHELIAQRAVNLVPLLVKLSPDLEQQDLEIVADVARRTEVAGIIATNTTIKREGLRTPAEELREYGDGGLSGVPLQHRSTAVLATLYGLTGGRIPLIGVGGIFTAKDAWQKIRAGASLLQLYTGFIYQGPAIAKEINEGLESILAREGFKSLDDAIGCQAKELSVG